MLKGLLLSLNTSVTLKGTHFTSIIAKPQTKFHNKNTQGRLQFIVLINKAICLLFLVHLQHKSLLVYEVSSPICQLADIIILFIILLHSDIK